MSTSPTVPATPAPTNPDKAVTPATTITPTALPTPIEAEDKEELKEKVEQADGMVKSEEEAQEAAKN